jgi:hypothetical protein
VIPLTVKKLPFKIHFVKVASPSEARALPYMAVANLIF